MSNIKYKKTITFILIILWMVIVFCFSNQPSDASSELSGGITRTILKNFGGLEEKTVEEQLAIESIIRKIAHYTIYTLGGILILLYIDLHEITEERKLGLSWGIGTLYAITDEMHQLFVAGRSGEIRDVWLDSLGIITGICILMLILKIKEKR